MKVEIIKITDEFYNAHRRRETVVRLDSGEIKKYAAVLPDTATEAEMTEAMANNLRQFLV